MVQDDGSSQHSRKPSVDWGKVVGAEVTREDRSLSGLKVKGRNHKKGRRKRRRNSPSFEKKSSSRGASLRPLLFGGLILVILTGAGIWLLEVSSAQSPADTAPKKKRVSQINDHLKLDAQTSNIYDLPPPRVAKNFALSDSLEERLKWTRSPEIISSRLHRYDPQALDAPASVIKFLGTSVNSTSKYYVFVAVFPDGGRRLVAVIGTDKGPRVDFDAYAGLHSHPWKEILAGQTTFARARIVLEPMNYNVRSYQDIDRWASFRISSIQEDGILYGYVERDSKLHKKLILLTGVGRSFSILDLEINPEDIKNKQVRISAVYSDTWIEDKVAPAKDE
ncbi:MAG: hypothetical protein ACON5H_05345 [Akkermansiaceae bacterium]